MKPILFSTPMVQAILDGRKTMTRRVMKPTVNGGAPVPLSQCAQGAFDINKNGECFDFYDTNGYYSGAAKQYIFAGDILWVRETWGSYAADDSDSFNLEVFYKADFPDGAKTYEWPEPDEDGKKIICDLPRWRPSIHMPKDHARIFLRVTDVRVDRVQGISESDARAEGCITFHDKIGDGKFDDLLEFDLTAKDAFEELWDHINAARGYGWDENPWVWVYSFERITREEAMEAST